MTDPPLEWFEIQRHGGGVSRIRERWLSSDVRCNMWHVVGRDRDVLIDTGFGFRSLVDEVAQLRARPVLAVASHTHFDHVGGHHQFAERAVHRSEAHVLAAPDDDNTVWRNYAHDPLLEQPPAAGFDLASWHVPSAPASVLLDDGDVIDLGDRVLEVRHLPGHSPGSICLWEAATATLFSGDVVYDGVLFDHLYHSDRDLYRESLGRLLDIPASTYHGGHGESFGRDRLEVIVDDYLSGRMRRSG